MIIVANGESSTEYSLEYNEEDSKEDGKKIKIGHQVDIHNNDTLMIQEENYTYYSYSLSKSSRWVDKKDVPATPEVILKDHHLGAKVLRLDGDFIFYGHLIDKIVLTTGGFIHTNEMTHSMLTYSSYIAPLMANFYTTSDQLPTGTLFVFKNIEQDDNRMVVASESSRCCSRLVTSKLNCQWCEKMKLCSDGFDRKRQFWVEHNRKFPDEKVIEVRNGTVLDNITYYSDRIRGMGDDEGSNTGLTPIMFYAIYFFVVLSAHRCERLFNCLKMRRRRRRRDDDASESSNFREAYVTFDRQRDATTTTATTSTATTAATASTFTGNRATNFGAYHDGIRIGHLGGLGGASNAFGGGGAFQAVNDLHASGGGGRTGKQNMVLG
ncbi:hypothetical protein HELRODRAFT_172338 [Helobdella robusta]|uniref:Uncharacterized protein n=1 Tax=Helobdella robusta TaxID=6412 RepID=T1F575_HELRO|nr:hypothetical protein HELRODRAFT_172338 [Helobdella robusta]ESO04670.1 hypothetical protein HELRODRAFT_172338 [Helobdella robusta]